MALKLTKEQKEKLFDLIERKLIHKEDIDWQEIVDELNLDIHRDTLRKATFLYPIMKEYFEEKFQEGKEQKILDELTIKKIELQKERNKLSAEKHELNKWIREQARAENIYEKIENAIKNLKPIKVPELKIRNTNNKRIGLIDIADCHFGREGVIKGLKGEVLAEYNVDIFKRRMWELLENSIEIIEKEKLQHVIVLNLSDSIDGILRMSQLQFLQLGLVDQTMQFAEFMSEWLNKLSEYVTVDYRSVIGNHVEIRPLSSQRGDFKNENMERIITWYIKERLKDNLRIDVYNAEHLVYFEVCGTNILATHGQDEKNLEQSIKDYSLIYNTPIHMLRTGHLHHGHSKTISMNGIQNIEIVQVPSICGIDEYSLKLKKTANAGTYFTIFEDGYGKFITYDIRLK